MSLIRDRANGGRVRNCNLVAAWDDDEPAYIAYKDVATRFRVRLQGSRYQRMNGRTINNLWPPRPYLGPADNTGNSFSLSRFFSPDLGHW